MPDTRTSDLAFAYQLRDTVTRYLAAVDAWERKHGQSYRLPSRGGQIAPDLASETAAYAQARRTLEKLVPRARLLYHANSIRDPFNALLRINPGASSPQSGTRVSIGGNERTDVARGLVDLIAACAPIGPTKRPQPTERKKQSALDRLLGFFR